MSAVLITGMSGAGKSTIAGVLARRGLASVDADDDPLLARSVDSDGNVVDDPSAPDFAWLSRHSWAWDPARLDVLIRTAAPATLYVCGGAANELELADRFTQVFLLEMDEPTMLARRMRQAGTTNGVASGDTCEHLRRRLPGHQDRLRAFGAIPIDARQPSTRWWTRYSPTPWPAPPRARPASRTISPLDDPAPFPRRSCRDSRTARTDRCGDAGPPSFTVVRPRGSHTRNAAAPVPDHRAPPPL
jgi:hypothetical protein